MTDHLEYEGLFFSKDSFKEVNDNLAIESPLEISINNAPFTVVMQTPGNELELSLGLLFAEDVIQVSTPYEYQISENRINFSISPELIRDGVLGSRSLLSVSSCGICGKKELGDINISGSSLSDQLIVNRSVIEHLFSTLKSHQELFKKTGGTHAIGAYKINGELLSLMEDVGRHNALDKVVGELILKNMLNEAKIIVCSGRLSFEIVSKAFRSKIALVASVSAPTTLAVDFAKEYGMTLIGFSRENKFTCYSNPFRISK